jgi:hypothetical protein
LTGSLTSLPQYDFKALAIAPTDGSYSGRSSGVSWFARADQAEGGELTDFPLLVQARARRGRWRLRPSRCCRRRKPCEGHPEAAPMDSLPQRAALSRAGGGATIREDVSGVDGVMPDGLGNRCPDWSPPGRKNDARSHDCGKYPFYLPRPLAARITSGARAAAAPRSQ